MSDSVRPQRQQPTRLPCPWDSPGKNTGVGCHFLLQRMTVKSEREVAQSCPTPSDPMDCSLPGSSVHGIFQARVLEWGAIAFSLFSLSLFNSCFRVFFFLFHLASGFSQRWFCCLLLFLCMAWVTLSYFIACHNFPRKPGILGSTLQQLWILTFPPSLRLL